MEEYIDKNKLIRDLIDNRSFYPAIVKNAIENTPIEDVVPRSEVEKAKQDVASRIIGCLVSKKNELCQVEYHQKEIDDYFLRTLEFWDYIDDFVGLTGEEILAELKKKYIGE